MAVYPAAVKRLIAPGSSDPRITPTQAILHVAVFEGPSLYEFFRDRSGGIESHFYIRRDGTVEQYRDTGWQADANYKANDRAISIETQGMGLGEWTPAQLDAIKALLLWLNAEHGIPLTVCPAWDKPGVGYHTLFGAPSPWTPVAKSCPGPDRIRQFHGVLVPWFDTSEEIDVALTAKDLTRVLRRKLTKKGDYEIRDALLQVRAIANEVRAIRQDVAYLREKSDGSTDLPK